MLYNLFSASWLFSRSELSVAAKSVFFCSVYLLNAAFSIGVEVDPIGTEGTCPPNVHNRSMRMTCRLSVYHLILCFRQLYISVLIQ